jgi:hypothetical protein
MKMLFASTAAAALATPAPAQELVLAPLAEARLRYEHVEQENLPLDADALTLRARAGLSATAGALTALVQAQGTLAMVDDYSDGLHGPATRPIVADPENLALYRAQLQYRTQPLTLTAGRQVIALQDERFVGNAAFRQNAQTFDALRAEITPTEGLKADLVYAWGARTIWGVDGGGARQEAVGGENLFANLSWASPLGTLTGFAYLVDQDEPQVQGFRLSSQSYGVRLAGTQPLGGNLRLAYQASYATQSDYHRNPNDYGADHWLADATLEAGALKLNAGYEVLGADQGTALTSFQFPLGSNFKFQGWADKFLTTPPNGLRDLYGGVAYGWKGVGPFATLGLQAAYHRFTSDRLSLDYGDELNLLASAGLGKVQLSARYAQYWADQFDSDTSKLWLQMDWSY